MMRRPWIILHDVHFFLPHNVAPEILFELDAVLQRHAQVASLVVVMEELFWRMHFVDVLPAAAGIWLEESWEADVVEQFLPVQRINQVAHRMVRSSFGMLVVRQNHRRRNRYSQLVGQRVVEELVVSGPPE